VLFLLITSELQGCGELEEVTLNTVVVTELRDKPGVKIEQTFSNLRRVGDDRSDAVSATAEAMKTVGSRPGVVVDLLNPTPNYTNSCTALESLDNCCLQIRENSILIVSRRILGVELYLPDSSKLEVLLREDLCVGKPGNECPIVQTKCRETIWIVVAGRRPKR
jgi:hypothetical protein